MELIIDGYNFIGREQGLVGPLEPKRNRLLQELSVYCEKKKFEATVVFDGWQSGSRYEVEEKKERIKVVFSRLGEKADAVIIRIARAKGSGCVIVTSDREIQSAADKFGAVCVRSGEFADVLRSVEGAYDVDDDPETDFGRKGNPRRQSKADRRHAEMLRKLRFGNG